MVTAATWRARLRDFVQMDVKGAADLGQLDSLDSLPRDTLFTVRIEEIAGTDNLTRPIRQVVLVRMAIIIGLRNFSDARGEGGADEIEAVRRDIERALLEWQPAGAFGGCYREGGQAMPMGGKTAWWQDVWIMRETLTRPR